MTPQDTARLVGCDPELIHKVDLIQEALAILGFETRVGPDGGFRTVQRQQQLYAKGRTVPGEDVTPERPMGRIVTNADGIHSMSNHQGGRACDLVFVDAHGNPSWAGTYPWGLIGAAGKALGMIWGGDFKAPAPHDLPHLELPKPVPTIGV